MSFDEWTILAALMLQAIAGYVAWPSRWNVIAHMSLAFGIVAYVVPIALTRVLEVYESVELHNLSLTLLAGSLALALGSFIGRFLAPRTPRVFVCAGRARLDDDQQNARVVHRVVYVVGASVILMFASFIIMGFAPALAENPAAAKFFRGEYYSAYQPVRVPYRLAWAILPVALPLVLTAVITRTAKYRISAIVVAIATLVATFLSMSRSNLGSALLIVVMVALILRGRYVVAWMFGLFSYVLGSLWYLVLGAFGISFFGSDDTSRTDGFVAAISTSAPDVLDFVGLYTRWVSEGESITAGRTILGGLIPGNYQWNPSVWTVTLGDPSVDISEISTGGLRVPISLWGLFNFGSIGVVLLPLLSGVLTAFVMQWVARQFPVEQMWPGVLLIMLLSTFNSVLGGFVTISYLDVVGFLVLWWCLRPLLSALPQVDALEMRCDAPFQLRA